MTRKFYLSMTLFVVVVAIFLKKSSSADANDATNWFCPGCSIIRGCSIIYFSTCPPDVQLLGTLDYWETHSTWVNKSIVAWFFSQYYVFDNAMMAKIFIRINKLLNWNMLFLKFFFILLLETMFLPKKIGVWHEFIVVHQVGFRLWFWNKRV